MQKIGLFWRIIIVIFLIVIVFGVGWPAAYVAIHGWNPEGWPTISGTSTPFVWFDYLMRDNLGALVDAYSRMWSAQSAAFADGGFKEVVALVIVTAVWSAILLTEGEITPPRDPSGPHGNADWASKSELARMNKGLELGIDPATGKAVRIQVEGNLLTIAPPRSGKTGGFIIPNLACPEPNAWAGPAVVVDPKGDVFLAVRRRREAMGKTVRCLDPLECVGGKDRWNPLSRVDPNDVLYLQSMALALLPQAADQSAEGAYFRNRAVDLIVGAFQCSIRQGRADPVSVAALLSDQNQFLDALREQDGPVANAAREILLMEDRSRDGIISTVRQATQWLLDNRMQAVVRDRTFELSDLASGDVDLFIVLPADDRKAVIAPYVRWLLADLFATVRHVTPTERIVAFIDEAYVLGRFDAILEGAGELPGYGISLWTIWQSRHQMVATYGETGAEVLLGTAEMTNVFNLPAAQANELERWSQAIGTYTGIKTTKTGNGRGKATESQGAEPRRLVPASDLPAFFKEWQVVFLTNSYTRNPLKLARTTAYTDRRFKRLIDGKPPVGTIN